MTEIVPGIHRIDTPLGQRVNSLYLFVGDVAALLFDTGMGEVVRTDVLPYLRDLGRDVTDVRYVIVSHGDVDHFGGNRIAREAFPNAALACHLLDQYLVEDVEQVISRRYGEFGDEHRIDEAPETYEQMRADTHACPVDLLLTGGERIRLDDGWHVEVLHTPGHSRGHLSIWDPRSDALIIGDAVLGETVPFADGAAAFPPTYRYVDSYLATIQRMALLDPQWLLTAHYPTMKGPEAVEFLARSRAFAETLEAAALRALRSRPTPWTTRELIAELAPRVGSWPEGNADVALAQPLVGHLERLVAHQIVDRLDGNGTVAWTAAAE